MNGHFIDFNQTGSKVRTNNTNHFFQDKENERSFYGFSSTGSKVRTNNTNHFWSSRQRNKADGHFTGFHQMAQMLLRITSIISTLQDKQNKWSFYGFSSTNSKARTNNTIHFYSSQQANERSFYGFLTTGSKGSPFCFLFFFTNAVT